MFPRIGSGASGDECRRRAGGGRRRRGQPRAAGSTGTRVLRIWASVELVLGPLLGARGGPEPFLETLLVLFDHQGNYAATARTLHLSVRAVTYRLDRIRAMTGYHPGESTQRFTLHAAVLGAKLIGWPANSGPADAASPT